jgi:hypothetical protein
MIERFHYPKCRLNIGQHKTIDSSIHLEVRTRVEDEYGVPDPNDNPEHYTDGVRATGELSFDSWPLGWNDSPVKVNSVGQLTILDGSESTKLNVLFIQKNSEQTIIKDKQKRYFWLFYVLGRPIYDRIEIFPERFRGKLVNKVYTCTDFRGIWPIGVSSVVVAIDKVTAKRMLLDALKRAGIEQPEMNDLTLQELDLSKPGAFVLNTGDY